MSRRLHWPTMKRIALLGATGSIGRQALEIVDGHPGLELVAAASGSRPIDGLAPLTQVGGDLTELLEAAEPDVVLNAVVGFAGLPATLWTLERGIDLALANKESLVAGGKPAGFTPADALAHPTWSMGPKITVDSATLMNKGLELIEAHFLFRLPYGRIEVVLHPTSVVHALVRFRDGAALAHVGYPDMRVPISFALTYPERAQTAIPPLDLAGGLILEFYAPDEDAFPCLALARAAGGMGGTAPCVLNAANEVAVASFLDGRLPFLGIADVVERTLATVDAVPVRDLEELVAVDGEARRVASALTRELVH